MNSPHGHHHDASHRKDSESSAYGSLSTLREAIRWAMESDSAPAASGAEWITREIVPAARSPFDALLSTDTSKEALRELKDAFKLLRTSGANAAERSMAARLYAGTIAVALVRHRERISSQADTGLARAFRELADDDAMPERLRELATLAIELVEPRN